MLLLKGLDVAERKLDIFRVLAAVDAKNRSFYESLTEEEIKGLTPFVVARWLSGTSQAGQVYFINELFNPFAFALCNHKQLLWYLLTICGSGKKQRYVWNTLPGKKNTTRPQAVHVVKQYLKYSTSEAMSVLQILSDKDILNMAEEMGWQPEELSKLKKELKIKNVTENTPVTSPPTTSLLDF